MAEDTSQSKGTGQGAGHAGGSVRRPRFNALEYLETSVSSSAAQVAASGSSTKRIAHCDRGLHAWGPCIHSTVLA